MLGGAYLIWFGARLLGSRGAVVVDGTADAAHADTRAVSLVRRLRIGLVTQLSNAQAVVFVTSIFAMTSVLASSLATGLACIGVH